MKNFIYGLALVDVSWFMQGVPPTLFVYWFSGCWMDDGLLTVNPRRIIRDVLGFVKSQVMEKDWLYDHNNENPQLASSGDFHATCNI
jgi:hypothetical protein